MMGYEGVKNGDVYCRLDKIPACDKQTDILRRHSPRYAYASRGNKAQALGPTVESPM